MAFESNPLKVKVRELVWKAAANGESFEAADYETQEIGKWELMIRIKPEPSSQPRYFKLKITEQL